MIRACVYIKKKSVVICSYMVSCSIRHLCHILRSVYWVYLSLWVFVRFLYEFSLLEPLLLCTWSVGASCERFVTPLLQEFMDPSVCYVPNGYSSYYYGGYDGTTNEWEDYSRYMNLEGVEMSAGFMGIMAHSYTTMDMDMHLIAHIH